MTAARFSRGAVSAILWSQWAYWSMLAVAIWAYVEMPPGSVRALLILAPIAPGILIFAVSYWLYQSCDEYIKLRTLQAATLTAATVALLSLIYFLLELLGFPRLSMMWIHVVGWSLFDFQMLWVALKAR